MRAGGAAESRDVRARPRSCDISTIRQIPWPRILVEGVVIVGSILLAFGIDAWWARKQQAAEEERVLTTLAAEFRTNSALLDARVQWQAGVQAAVEAILLAASERPRSLSADSLDHLMADISWWGGPEELEMSAVDAGGRRRRSDADPE